MPNIFRIFQLFDGLLKCWELPLGVKRWFIFPKVYKRVLIFLNFGGYFCYSCAFHYKVTSQNDLPPLHNRLIPEILTTKNLYAANISFKCWIKKKNL